MSTDSKIDRETLDQKMEDLAVAMAVSLAKNEKVTKEKVDAFRALSAYFAATRKLGLRPNEDDEQENTFGSFRSNIDKASPARQ